MLTSKLQRKDLYSLFFPPLFESYLLQILNRGHLCKLYKECPFCPFLHILDALCTENAYGHECNEYGNK
jgi:hypothetical protein